MLTSWEWGQFEGYFLIYLLKLFKNQLFFRRIFKQFPFSCTLFQKFHVNCYQNHVISFNDQIIIHRLKWQVITLCLYDSKIKYIIDLKGFFSKLIVLHSIKIFYIHIFQHFVIHIFTEWNTWHIISINIKHIWIFQM